MLQDRGAQGVVGAGSAGAQVTAIDHYRVDGELGRGGMGVVYRGFDTRLQRNVAIKVILDAARAGEKALERFRREAAAIGQLRHRNIVQVYDAGSVGGRPYLVMELVEGKQLVKEGKLPPRRAAEIAHGLALALAHAHEHGIIHRDVKPHNIIVDAEGVPKLMDFGLARDEEDVGERLTVVGELLGTPAYMAPEQASGASTEHGPHTDIYALGTVLYQIVAGRPPFMGKSNHEVLMKVMNEQPTSLRELDKTVPAELDTIALKCLEKDPKARFTSAAEAASRLDGFLNPSSGAAKPIARRSPNSSTRIRAADREDAVASPSPQEAEPAPRKRLLGASSARRRAATPPEEPVEKKRGVGTSSARHRVSSQGVEERRANGESVPGAVLVAVALALAVLLVGGAVLLAKSPSSDAPPPASPQPSPPETTPPR